MTISFSGLASGLDTSSWVESLVALKRAKITTLEEQKEQVTVSKSTLNTVKSFFQAFRSSLERVTDAKFGISSIDLFVQNLANSSNVSALTASADTTAKEGTYKIIVDKVASNTEAVSKYSYVTTIVETTTADDSSRLANLGINNTYDGEGRVTSTSGGIQFSPSGDGVISLMVDGIQKSIVLRDYDTLETFANKLRDAGVDASYNRSTGTFNANLGLGAVGSFEASNNYIINDGTEFTESVIEALHLSSVNEGYTSSKLQEADVTTVYELATLNTKLSELGATAGIVTIQCNDASYNFDINLDTTINSFVTALKGQSILADFDEYTGILSITDASITLDEANLVEALGLDIDTYSKSQRTKNLSQFDTVTVRETVTNDTLLSEIGMGTVITPGTISVMNSNGVLSEIAVDGSTNIGDVIGGLTDAGLFATLHSDGTVEIAGGEIVTSGEHASTFDIVGLFGLETEPYSSMAMGNQLSETITIPAIVELTTELVGDLGVSSGYYEVTNPDGDVFYNSVYEGQTIANLIADLGHVGISAALDSENGILTVNGGDFRTLTNSEVHDLCVSGDIQGAAVEAGTNMLSLLGLDVEANMTVLHTSARSMALTRNVVETIDATSDSKLSVYGISNGMSTAERTVVVYDSDGNVKDSMVVTENTTLGSLISFIDGQSGVSASLEDGVITIDNGFISAALSSSELNVPGAVIKGAVVDALGLQNTNKSSYVLGSVMTTTSTVTDTIAKTTTSSSAVQYDKTYKATETDVIANFVSMPADTNLVVHQKTGAPVVTVSVTNTMTFGELFSVLSNYDVDGEIHDGIVMFDSDDERYLTGDLLGAMGMTTTYHTTTVTTTVGTSSTGTVHSFTTTHVADASEKLSVYTISGSLTVYDAVGNSIGAFTTDANTTFAGMFSSLEQYGVACSLDDGRVTFVQADGGWVSGTLVTALGISTTTSVVTSTTTTTTGTTSTGTVHSFTTTHVADASEKLSVYTISGSLTVYDAVGNSIGAFTTDANTTFAGMFSSLEQYGVACSLDDGRVTFVQGDGGWVSGTLVTALGISTTTSVVTSTTTTTVGATSYGSSLSRTLTYSADGDTTFGQLGMGHTKDYQILNGQDGSTVFGMGLVSDTTTIGEFFNAIGQHGLHGSIDGGYISISSDADYYLAGGLATFLGIGTMTAYHTVHGSTTTVATAAGVVTISASDTMTVNVSQTLSVSSISTVTVNTSDTITVNVVKTLTVASTGTTVLTTYSTITINLAQTLETTNTVRGYAMHVSDANMYTVTTQATGTVTTTCTYTEGYTQQLNVTGEAVKPGTQNLNINTAYNAMTMQPVTATVTTTTYASLAPSFTIVGIPNWGHTTVRIYETGVSDGNPFSNAVCNNVEDVVEYLNNNGPYQCTSTVTGQNTVSYQFTKTSNDYYIEFSYNDAVSPISFQGLPQISTGNAATPEDAIKCSSTKLFAGNYSLDTTVPISVRKTVTRTIRDTSRPIPADAVYSMTYVNNGVESTTTLSSGTYISHNSHTDLNDIIYNLTNGLSSLYRDSSTGVCTLYQSAQSNYIKDMSEELKLAVFGTCDVDFVSYGSQTVTATQTKTMTLTSTKTVVPLFYDIQYDSQPGSSYQTRIDLSTELYNNGDINDSTNYWIDGWITGSDQYNTGIAGVVGANYDDLIYFDGNVYTPEDPISPMYVQNVVRLGYNTTVTSYTTVTVCQTQTLASTTTLTIASTGLTTVTVLQTHTVDITQTLTVNSTGSTTVNVTRTYTIDATQTATVDVTGTVTIDLTSTNTITINKTGSKQTYQVTDTMAGNSTISDFAGDSGSISGYCNGSAFTVDINSNTTVDGLIGMLAAYGVQASVSGGAMTFSGTNYGYVTGASGSGAALGAASAYSTSTHTSTHTEGYNSGNSHFERNVTNIMNGNTMLSQVGLGTGTISGYYNGAAFTVNLNANTTIDGLIGMLGAYGVQASVTGGAMTFTGTNTGFITSASGSGSSLGAQQAYSTSTHTSTHTEGYNSGNSHFERNITNIMNGNTMLSQVGLGDGTIYGYYNNQAFTVNLGANTTIDGVIGMLAAYGIQASVSGGAMTFNGTNTGFITGATGSGSNLGAQAAYSTSTATTIDGENSASTLRHRTVTHDMTTASTLGDIGLGAGNETVTIVQNGTQFTVTVDSSKSLDDMISTMAAYGISGSITGGQLSLSGADGSYITGISENLATSLKLSSGLDNTYTTSERTIVNKMQDSTSLSDYDVSEGEIEIVQQGVHYTATIADTMTVNDLRNLLGQYGFTSHVDDEGRLEIHGNGESYLASVSGGSNLITKLGFTQWSLGEVTSTSSYLADTESVDPVITGNTRILDLQNSDGDNLGIDTGSFYVYQNGVRNTLSIEEDTTVNDLMADLAEYGIVADISESGEIAVSGNSNTYLATSNIAGSRNSNIVETLFSEWNFTRVYESNDLTIPTPVIQSITESTKLSNIIADDEFEPGEFTIMKDGIATNVTLTSDDTVGTFMNIINQFGFDAVLNNKGQIIVRSDGDSSLISTSGTNVLELLGLDNWTFTNTYEGQVEDETSVNVNTIAISRDTALRDILFDADNNGVLDSLKDVNNDTVDDLVGEYYIFNNGVRYTAMISSDETVGSFLDTLGTFGIQANIVQSADGKHANISIKGNGDSYIAKSNSTTNASDVVDMFASLTEMKEYNSTSKVEGTKTTWADATEDTRLSELDYLNGLTVDSLWNSESQTASIAVSVDGEVSTINISKTDTVGTLLSKFRALGLEATISNGEIMVQSGYKTMSIQSAGTSAFFTGEGDNSLKLTYDDDLGGYIASTAAIEATTTVFEDKTVSAVKYAAKDTKLGTLNISSGSLSVYRDGRRVQINIDEDDVFSSSDPGVSNIQSKINNKLAELGATADIVVDFDKNGYLQIYSSGGANVYVGASSDKSNFVSITGVTSSDDAKTVTSSRELYQLNGATKLTTAGIFRNGDVTLEDGDNSYFIVGNARISVTSNSTMDDIVAQINSNSEESNAKAYWDNVSGQIKIESLTGGASFVNIERGTTNFTDVMGYTVTEDGVSRMNTDSQNLGSNAKFKINGTTYTSSSNVVDSAISRIEGVTINLKDVSNNEVVTLTIEKDRETVADAVSGVVDAYNELMKNVDEAIAKEGDLHAETTLKHIRDQLKMIMSSSDSAATRYINLHAIGLGTAAPTGSNISVSNESIVQLYFDKDKFMNKLSTDTDAVKRLLVGTGINSENGIFNRIENVIEGALAGVSGYFDTAARSYDTKISKLNSQISKANTALDNYRAQLEAKFSSMDMLIAQMQQQYSSFLKT